MILIPILFLLSVSYVTINEPAPVKATTAEIYEHNKKHRETFPGENK